MCMCMLMHLLMHMYVYECLCADKLFQLNINAFVKKIILHKFISHLKFQPIIEIYTTSNVKTYIIIYKYNPIYKTFNQ